MIRFFDFIFAVIGLIIFFPVFAIIYCISILGNGSPLFFQSRVGINKKPFTLIKFRSMSKNSISVASHLADKKNVTKFGKFLRKTKLDELPQLWNVFVGNMSFVGPRPNLFNQYELIEKRDNFGIYKVRPGITGLSQINNIDMSKPDLLTKYDKKMIDTMCLRNYFKYILLTLIGRGKGDSINN